MPQFSRIRPHEKPKAIEGSDRDIRLDDLGFLFCNHNGKWSCESRLTNPGGRVHDVIVHPRCLLGKPGDVACTTDSKWWKKNHAGEWVFQFYLIPPPWADITTGKLTVMSNFSVPVVDGKVPIYKPNGVLRGHLLFIPLDN